MFNFKLAKVHKRDAHFPGQGALNVGRSHQFLIDEKTANSGRTLVGWTVLPPGAAHERHRHPNVDEFWIVIKGEGVMYSDDGEDPSGEGDVVFTPAGYWHGFRNTSDEDVVLVWGWSGAGSLEKAGYEIPDDGSHSQT